MPNTTYSKLNKQPNSNIESNKLSNRLSKNFYKIYIFIIIVLVIFIIIVLARYIFNNNNCKYQTNNNNCKYQTYNNNNNNNNELFEDISLLNMIPRYTNIQSTKKTEPQISKPQPIDRTQLYGSIFLDKLDEQIKQMTDPDIKYDTKRIQLNKYDDVLK